MDKFEYMSLTAFGDYPKVHSANQSVVGNWERRDSEWRVDGPLLSDYLAEQGQQGWEVCGAYSITVKRGYGGVVLLKRPCNSD